VSVVAVPFHPETHQELTMEQVMKECNYCRRHKFLLSHYLLHREIMMCCARFWYKARRTAFCIWPHLCLCVSRETAFKESLWSWEFDESYWYSSVYL